MGSYKRDQALAAAFSPEEEPRREYDREEYEAMMAGANEWPEPAVACDDYTLYELDMLAAEFEAKARGVRALAARIAGEEGGGA